MPYVNVDVDLYDFDDDDLIEELEGRGYHLDKKSEKYDMETVIWHFKNGRANEALIALGRIEPHLSGISDKVIETEKVVKLLTSLERIKKELTPGVSGYYVIEQIVNEALNEYR